ncbi:MAG: hypothetical protein IJX02_08125 [Clostridia bacterium]|nr:hypothetical protein [Clostridia bacterium]
MTREKECEIRSIEHIKQYIKESKELKYYTKLVYNLDENYDKNSIIKKIKNWLSNKQYRDNLMYVFVPEYRQKYNILILHGITNGKLDLMPNFTYKIKGFEKSFSEEEVKKKIRKNKIKESDIESEIWIVRDWKFGDTEVFVKEKSIENIRNYIFSYIEKGLSRGDKRFFHRRYLSSKNIE